jgi:aspartate aminotransferase
MLAEFARRRRFVLERLRAIAGIAVVSPRGAFYVLPNVEAFLGRRFGGRVLATATDLARYLLAEHGVAVVAGDDFAAPRHLRISYATSMALLEQGLDRLAAGLHAIASAPR